jgi:signal transduction histidine kinase
MPTGGEVRITTADCVVASGETAQIPGGHWVVLSVIDPGVGIDDAVKARLFEPFFTTKDPGKGTGLGLATVFGIVQQSGGHIKVESELGQGAAFHVFLPARRGRATGGRRTS